MMKHLLNEWRKYLVEEKEDQAKKDEIFNNNVEKINDVFHRFEYYTPEGSKILTEIELGKEIGFGAYGRVFEIVGSKMVIKFFRGGISGADFDVERMKKLADKLFSGTANFKGMHYFDIGKIQNNVNYVVMPRITPFQESFTYKQNPNVFLAVGNALHEASKDLQEKDTYADFRENFYKYMAKGIHLRTKYKFTPEEKDERKKFEEDFFSSINEYDETIHKILRIAYETFKEEGGTDLHLGNMGFFPQKPDDWFFFDM